MLHYVIENTLNHGYDIDFLFIFRSTATIFELRQNIFATTQLKSFGVNVMSAVLNQDSCLTENNQMLQSSLRKIPSVFVVSFPHQ